MQLLPEVVSVLLSEAEYFGMQRKGFASHLERQQAEGHRAAIEANIKDDRQRRRALQAQRDAALAALEQCRTEPSPQTHHKSDQPPQSTNFESLHRDQAAEQAAMPADDALQPKQKS